MDQDRQQDRSIIEIYLQTIREMAVSEGTLEAISGAAGLAFF